MFRQHIEKFESNGQNNNSPNSGGNNGNGQNNREPKKQGVMVMLVAALVTLLCMSYVMKLMNSSENQQKTYTEFVQMLENGEVDTIKIESDRIVFTPKHEVSIYGGKTAYYTGIAESASDLTQRVLDYNSSLPEEMQTEENLVTIEGSIPDGSSTIINILLVYVLPIVLIWILLSFAMRRISKSGGGAFGVGKSNAKVYGEKATGVTFKDVAGEDEAKESLVEIVDFLHNPLKYSKIGAKIPKGALLVGPPGTGKTLLAKAVAGEAKVPFFSLAGSDFIELYVGVGASRVRDLFKEAEKNAPCIIFIDEIDAIGRSRDSKYGGGNEEREQTLNQLLSEMDGFDGKKGIIILAATNRPEILDKALLRPGRFDRRVIVDKPDLKGREAILKVHAKDVLMDETVDLHEIALATSGAVGADLSNMINEAAINAVKEGREAVSQKDLFQAVEIVLVGKEKKDRIMSKEERRIVSYHEVGHALISALQKNSEPVQKITIVPRTMGALGYVMHVPEEEKYLNTEAELRDMLVGLLGGRAAEEIVFDTVTTGASNDIEKATSIARSMVTQYGMSKKFGLIGLETVESQYLDGRKAMNCADVTAAGVDEEVMSILKDSYAEAIRLLSENRTILDNIAAYLIEKETITGKEFMQIFRKEKGLPEPVEEKKNAQEALAETNGSDLSNGILKTKETETVSIGSFDDYLKGADASPKNANTASRTEAQPEYPREQPGYTTGSDTDFHSEARTGSYMGESANHHAQSDFGMTYGNVQNSNVSENPTQSGNSEQSANPTQSGNSEQSANPTQSGNLTQTENSTQSANPTQTENSKKAQEDDFLNDLKNGRFSDYDNQ